MDLVRVADVQAALQRFGDRYLSRIFTPTEIGACLARPATAAMHLAARFAAKEAVRKVLRPEPDAGLGFRTIEVVRDASGAPELVLHAEAAGMAEARHLTQFALSLTHEAEYASAVVIAQHVTRRRTRARVRHRKFERNDGADR